MRFAKKLTQCKALESNFQMSSLLMKIIRGENLSPNINSNNNKAAPKQNGNKEEAV